MKHKQYFIIVIFFIAGVMLAGCGTSKSQLLKTDASQVQLRSIQTRAFDTADKEKTMRNVISTLQDLDFVIEKADLLLGTVTGTKFKMNVVLKMSVSVRPRGETQMLIRANAQYGIKAVEDPEPYQDFFTALEKAMFLTSHQVD